MSKELQLQLQLAFNDLDTILFEKFFGKISDEFIKLVNATREEIKNKEQLHINLSTELTLQIDKAFDEYIESK